MTSCSLIHGMPFVACRLNNAFMCRNKQLFEWDDERADIQGGGSAAGHKPSGFSTHNAGSESRPIFKAIVFAFAVFLGLSVINEF